MDAPHRFPVAVTCLVAGTLLAALAAGTTDTTGTSGPATPVAVTAAAPPTVQLLDAAARTSPPAAVVSTPLPPGPAVEVRPSPEGHLVVGGTERVGAGPTLRFTVEVEPATGLDPAEVLRVAQRALYDDRSWRRDATLERVDDPELADARLLFATPATVDELCAAAGLDTDGDASCWNLRFAAINADRYAHGADDFDDLRTYRTYVINHEIGHALGHGHATCLAPGATAPVMVQQTYGTEGCVANGWPYP